MPLTPDERQAIVSDLAANCECWKGEGEALGKLKDEQLLSLKQGQKHAAVANVAAEGFTTENRAYRINPDTGKWEYRDLAVNSEAKPTPADNMSKKKMPMPMHEEEEEDEEDYEKKGKKMAKNAAEVPAAPAKPATMQEWLAAMPPEAQGVWNNAVKVEQRERQALLARLTANVEGEAKQRLLQRFQGKPLEELADMIALLPVAPTANVQQESAAFTTPLYWGAGGGPTANVKDDSDNVLPTFNTIWEDVSKQRDLEQGRRAS